MPQTRNNLINFPKPGRRSANEAAPAQACRPGTLAEARQGARDGEGTGKTLQIKPGEILCFGFCVAAMALARAAFLNQGCCTNAEDALHRVLSLHVASNRHDDVFAAQVLNNLGAVYRRQRDFKPAEETYRKAIESWKAWPGTAH